MKKYFCTAFLAAIIHFPAFSQVILSPSDFLGYPMGTEFTFHHRALDYLKYVAEKSDKVIYRPYGTSYEGRELAVAFVSSADNLSRLEEYRMNNLAKTGLKNHEFTGGQIPFVWMSYNIHGNESNGMEAALEVLYTLATGGFEGVADWLGSCIIVIDPCLNPDGRERYTLNYRMMQSKRIYPDPNSWERSMPWPGSRSNHYFFDLNRDWTWQTQAESRQRLSLYHEFMPHVHADFHEMGPETDYFFPPGAEPWHNAITQWQREYHTLTGKANAALFDEKFRLYFSGEVFDLFGPSYGDTWPLFNGAMGFTYEQGGSGRAGLAMVRNIGDTLTLKHRIEGHFLASMATIQAAHDNRERLIEGFNQYFETAQNDPPFEYKSIIIKGSNEPSAVQDMLKLLDNNLIRYHYAGNTGKRYRGFSYLDNEETNLTVEQGDILIPAHQPQGHFVKVLFEPKSSASDSLSYDLTAWAIPFLYYLKSFAVRDRIPVSDQQVSFEKPDNSSLNIEKPYAYLVRWSGFSHVHFLATLFRHRLRVRSILQPLSMNNLDFDRGSLIITRADNTHLPDLFDKRVLDAAQTSGVQLHAVSSGLSDRGINLGSAYANLLHPPKIVTIASNQVSAGSLGEMRYFFEQELDYPLTIIDDNRINSIDLNAYDILILNAGDYSRFTEQIMDFVRQGGKVVAIGSATGIFANDEKTALGKAVAKAKQEQAAEAGKQKSDDPALLTRFENIRRDALSERSAGAVYRVHLDDSHPYAFGMGKQWFAMRSAHGLPFLENGRNIAYISDNEPVAGFAGYKYQERAKNTLMIGAERIGRGEVVYFADNPYLRAYWKSSRLLLGNILLIGQPFGYRGYDR